MLVCIAEVVLRKSWELERQFAIFEPVSITCGK